jgi:LysM repeat protein
MTLEIGLIEEITRSRKETHGASTRKKINDTPVFTSRMERREYGKSVHFFDIRHAIDMTGLLNDISENWNTYVSKVNRLIQDNPIKRLVLTGIFTIVLGVSAIHTSAAIVPEYTYQVKTGEKVENIASAHGVTANQIYSANGISSIDGQKLLLPKVENMTVTAVILNVRSQPTTESSIVGKLKRGNSVKVSFVEGGWAAIMIDGRICYVSTDFLAKNTEKNSSVKNSSTVYTVKPGDTFYKISKAFAVTASSLQKLNPTVEASMLKIGQAIKIPVASNAIAEVETAENSSISEYVIKPGDTFYKISKTLGVSVSSIQKLNPAIDPGKLKIGQSISIPTLEAKVPTQTERETNNIQSEYTIKSGDTFYSISKGFGISVSDIQKLNPTVDSTKLKIGQSISIPTVTAASQASQLKVEAEIVDITPQGMFQFSTANGRNYSAKASGVLLNELLEHKGETFILTLEAKRGRSMTLKAIH